MKKKIVTVVVIIILIAIIVVSIILLKSKNKNIQIDIENLASEILKSGAFEDELIKVDSEMIIRDYNFNPNEIENLVSYQGSGATSEEIVILKAKDKSNLNSIKDKINERIEERKDAFQSYLPQEVGKIDNNILKVEGNYVIFCVSNNSSIVNQVLNNNIK